MKIIEISLSEAEVFIKDNVVNKALIPQDQAIREMRDEIRILKQEVGKKGTQINTGGSSGGSYDKPILEYKCWGSIKNLGSDKK